MPLTSPIYHRGSDTAAAPSPGDMTLRRRAWQAHGLIVLRPEEIADVKLRGEIEDAVVRVFGERARESGR